MTNPPLGDINFQKLIGPYSENAAWYDAMDVIEKKPVRGGKGKTVTRSTLKGGALFINVFDHLLAKDGVVLTVIDEVVLDTDEYSDTRAFLKAHFDLRAIFSLTEDAFKNTPTQTATKTSILYCVKKDPTTRQRRPVFFGHAFQVGINPKGKQTRNDLLDASRPNDLYRAYLEFDRLVVENEERNGQFDPRDFAFPPAVLDGVGQEAFSDYSYFCVAAEDLEDRLEYKWYDPTYDALAERLNNLDTVELRFIVNLSRTNYGLTETGLAEGDYPFINIENLRPDATVDLRSFRYVETSKKLKPKHFTEIDDILISRSRLPGIAAVVDPEAAGLVYGSYIIRFHLSDDAAEEFMPEYVALFIIRSLARGRSID